MRVLLDTSVLLGPPVERGDHDFAISAASLAELHFGVTVDASEPIRAERLRRLALVESLFTPLPIDATVARHYGRVAGAVSRVGRTPRSRVMDLLIAATAVAHETSLWTHNPADFTGLEELVRVQAPVTQPPTSR
jgi:predicted nucleic acid-binding protein